MDHTKQIASIIREALPDVKAIYIFGSTETKFERKESDVDIAVWPNKQLKPLEIWKLSQQIARNIDKDVDLVDLSQASTVLRFQIISDGKRIYCQNPTACDFFENYIYSSYFYFNEERKELLQDIRKRGQIR